MCGKQREENLLSVALNEMFVRLFFTANDSEYGLQPGNSSHKDDMVISAAKPYK
jgi:hypothetical protein